MASKKKRRTSAARAGDAGSNPATSAPQRPAPNPPRRRPAFLIGTVVLMSAWVIFLLVAVGSLSQ